MAKNKGFMHNKRLIIIAVLAIMTSTSWGQSIGGVLSNGKQNATVSQHSITASDLKNLCTKKNNAACFSYLEKMGWKHQESSTTEDITTNTWALDLDYYDEDRAMAWLYVYSDSYGVEMVGYSFASDKFIRTFEQTITKAGFRPFDFSEYGENIIAGYQSSECLLFLERYGTSHKVNCIRKRGHYDRLNGKKRVALDEGGYIVCTLVNGKISGIVREYNDEDVLTAESNFENGERNGDYKMYHQDGKKVAMSGKYKDGKEQGTFTWYTESGNVWQETVFENGVKTLYRLYEGDHNLVNEETFDSQGKMKTWIHCKYRYDIENAPKGNLLEKEITDFTGNQPVYKKYLIQNGTELLIENIVKDGQCIIAGRNKLRLNNEYLWVVNDDGLLLPQSIFSEDERSEEQIKAEIEGVPVASVCVMTMKDGDLNGQFRCYVDTTIHRMIYMDGTTINDASQVTLSTIDTSRLQIYSQGTFANNAKTGKWNTYNPLTGKLCMEEFYNDGERIGEAHYYREGRSETYHFSKGERNGSYSYSDIYGLSINGSYLNDKRNGVWTWSTSESLERASLPLKDNKRNGTLNLYNRVGTLICSAEYENGVQQGTTYLYDTNGQLCFKAVINDRMLQSIVDYRNQELFIVSYSNLQNNIITISFEKDGEVTTVSYFRPKQHLLFRGCSTLAMALMVDSLWVRNVLFPSTVEHAKASGDVTVRGGFEKGEKTDVWFFKYPEQGVLIEFNYNLGEEKYLTLLGEPFSGTFEFYDYSTGIKEVKKIKEGVLKKAKQYVISTGKRYREPYSCDYFPIRKNEHNYILFGMPNMDSISLNNVNLYTNYSNNRLSFNKDDKPSFQPSPIDHAVLWPTNLMDRALQLYEIQPDIPSNREEVPQQHDRVLMIQQRGQKELEQDHDTWYEDFLMKKNEGEIIPDSDPQYPGGLEGLSNFIADNIRYPAEAKDAGITGKVYVSFVIEKDGSVGQVKVLRDIGGGCGEEAVRVVKSMPKWKPGTQNGKPVRTQFNLPITFDLQEK